MTFFLIINCNTISRFAEREGGGRRARDKDGERKNNHREKERDRVKYFQNIDWVIAF